MNAILQKILRYLILTDSGHKILKGILILIIGFILLPTIAFSPVAGFVNGVKNFFEGEGDLDDGADVSSFLGDDFSIIKKAWQRLSEKNINILLR